MSTQKIKYIYESKFWGGKNKNKTKVCQRKGSLPLQKRLLNKNGIIKEEWKKIPISSLPLQSTYLLPLQEVSLQYKSIPLSFLPSLFSLPYFYPFIFSCSSPNISFSSLPFPFISLFPLFLFFSLPLVSSSILLIKIVLYEKFLLSRRKLCNMIEGFRNP